MTLLLRCAALTDRGLIRGENQDCVHAGAHLLAVADGMGGMAAGEVASRIAIDTIAALDAPFADDAQVAALRGAFDGANARIAAVVAADPALQGMGTTLTAVLFSGTQVVVGHIGDSRAYLLRGPELTQLTRDDTYVQLLVDQGVITAEQASDHPRRAVVTQALQGEHIEPSYRVLVPMPGDRWLLCSDGLSTVVSATTIEQVMRDYAALSDCAHRLLDLALRAGGPDNITVVVADVVDD